MELLKENAGSGEMLKSMRCILLNDNVNYYYISGLREGLQTMQLAGVARYHGELVVLGTDEGPCVLMEHLDDIIIPGFRKNEVALEIGVKGKRGWSMYGWYGEGEDMQILLIKQSKNTLVRLNSISVQEIPDLSQCNYFG